MHDDTCCGSRDVEAVDHAMEWDLDSEVSAYPKHIG